ncbi:hypothetical protein O6H91_18G026600 [Diphasiastrum complanatum]|nr:hypothetical protein O6H91_18G026600 [Diphasiastrum complanatum]
MPQKDAVSWNAMIAGYAKHGNGEQALRLYQEMKLQGLKPNKVTFICILNACASLLAIEHGKRVHADISEARFESDVVVGSALVDMYIKCGSLVCARTVFNKMPKRNVISWTTLIGGYVKHGRSKHALKLSYKMKQEGIKPNEVTYICILNACASLADLAKGKQVHFDIIKAGYELDTKVGNALVDMYVKCANLLSAQNVFSRMLNRDTISWSTMIAGYLTFGSQDKALQLFGEMQRENVKPDDVTFINLLSVCSHVGLLNEGLALFESMTRDYGLTPRLEHYGCLVDLFGRAGRLEEADAFIKSMPIQPDASVWMALLGACKVKADIELAERISRHILKVDPQNEAVYVVLSNVYAAAGKWDAKMGVRKLMEERGVSKDPGRCWI